MFEKIMIIHVIKQRPRTTIIIIVSRCLRKHKIVFVIKYKTIINLHDFCERTLTIITIITINTTLLLHYYIIITLLLHYYYNYYN